MALNDSVLHGVAIAGVRELLYKFKVLKQGLSVNRTGNVAIGSRYATARQDALCGRRCPIGLLNIRYCFRWRSSVARPP